MDRSILSNFFENAHWVDERLKREAETRSCSISAIVRESVKRLLSENETKSAHDAVMELTGKYRSGTNDLAENHDAYLNDGW